jgi:hypothetical protein
LTKNLFDEIAETGFPDEPLLAETQPAGVIAKSGKSPKNY